MRNTTHMTKDTSLMTVRYCHYRGIFKGTFLIGIRNEREQRGFQCRGRYRVAKFIRFISI